MTVSHWVTGAVLGGALAVASGPMAGAAAARATRPTGKARPAATAPYTGPVFDEIDTTTTVAPKTIAFTTDQDTVQSACQFGIGGNATELDVTLSGPDAVSYTHGTVYVFGADSSDPLSWIDRDDGNYTEYGNGSDVVQEETAATSTGNAQSFAMLTSESSIESFQLHVLVNEKAHEYILDVAAAVSSTRCQVFTTVTPTNGNAAIVQ
jgi:hypothetical protein